MICATNGTDALALLARDKRIEILITDIKCQVLQGTSLLKKRNVCGMVSTQSYSLVESRTAAASR